MENKECPLNYVSNDPSAAEYYHEFYTDMMTDMRILDSIDFLRIGGSTLGDGKYIVIDVSPIKYIEESNIYTFTIMLYVDKKCKTRMDYVLSLIDYAIAKNATENFNYFKKEEVKDD